MKFLVNILRIFVGSLFVFSGLVKINDPVGFSFKLEEYFGPTVFDIDFLMPYTLVLAIIIVITEVLLGLFLLIGFKPKHTIWIMLLMIIFFTFLTWYSAYYNKVTDCGCFGDAIPLTPWESFTKDVFLLIFILILFFKIEMVKPIISLKNQLIVSSFALLISCAIVYRVIEHLPIIDFRPYKIEANIMDNMTIPDDAPRDIWKYDWKFIVDGKEKVVSTSGEYPSTNGEFVSVETELLEKGYEAPIHDFSMEINGQDFSKELLNEQKLLMFVLYNLSKSNFDISKEMINKSKAAAENGYKVIAITASGIDKQIEIKEKYGFEFDFYTCDETALKTIIRSNPGVLEIKSGTIVNKWHYNDFNKIRFD